VTGARRARAPETPGLDGTAPQQGRALGRAVLTAVVLLALVGLAYAAGRVALFAVVAAVALGGIVELLASRRAAGGRPVLPFALLCAAGVLVAGYAADPAWLVTALGATVAGALLLALRPGRGSSPATDAAWTVLGVAWIAGGGAAASRLAALEPGGKEVLVALVVVVAADDTAAFLFGARWGRHSLAPRISAAKSWEGAAAGAAAALAAGAAVGLPLDALTAAEGVGLGAVCAIAGPAGDLIESVVKRELGVKDFGALLPGHGGLLDRVDAMLVACPAVLLYLWALSS
jgi:phosphatidate cytidylyltransferase